MKNLPARSEIFPLWRITSFPEDTSFQCLGNIPTPFSFGNGFACLKSEPRSGKYRIHWLLPDMRKVGERSGLWGWRYGPGWIRGRLSLNSLTQFARQAICLVHLRRKLLKARSGWHSSRREFRKLLPGECFPFKSVKMINAIFIFMLGLIAALPPAEFISGCNRRRSSSMSSIFIVA